MKPIRACCTPRDEVLKGDLQDAIFAADFGHVVENRAPAVYQDPEQFFRNTHPTRNLKALVGAVFERLASPGEAGAAVRLSTGFGGGKTHTLITLWHLANTVNSTSLGIDLLPAAGRPKSVKVVGIDGGKGFTTGTVWGDVAHKLGVINHEEGRRMVEAPDAGTLASWLPQEPLLILMDELVIPMSEMNEQQQGALLAFVNRLIGEVGARTQAVLVISDPAGQRAYARQANALAEEMAKLEAAKRLDDVLGRKFSDFDPIGDEAPQVINRRLFTHGDRAAASAASAEYHNLYKRVADRDPSLLPPAALTADYAQRFVLCYPFHPRLLDTAQDRLSAMSDFQKGRGTLRLFARIIRDIWESKSDLPLVTAGDINWQSQRIQADLLERLNRQEFKAAVNADLRDHAGQLDADQTTDIHRRVASALLLESLPMTPSATMDKRDLALATLRPSDVGPEPGEAMDRLMAVGWHTYDDGSQARYKFSYQPNINKLIEERAQAVSMEDARAGVQAAVQAYFGGNTFALSAFPTTPRDVADSAKLKLVVAAATDLAQAVCDYEETSDPTAPRKRRFRNAIFAVAPNPDLLYDAVHARRREQAAAELIKEKQEEPQTRQALDKRLNELRRRARIAAYRAYTRICFQGRPSVSLEEKYLVPHDAPLDTVHGQQRLKQFLDDHRYVYQANDALDVDLLLQAIVAGATPSLTHPGAVSAKAVHERALASEKLRLLLTGDPVRNSMRNAVKQGRLLLRLPSGDVYDADGRVAGPAGQRKRTSGANVPGFELNDDVFAAPPDAECAAVWLKTDDEKPKAPLSIAEAAAEKYTVEATVRSAIEAGDLDAQTDASGEVRVLPNERWFFWKPEDRPVEITFANTWPDAVRLANERPTERVTLVATAPAGAQLLLAIGALFGVQSLTLAVSVGGTLKEGGSLNFKVKNVKHNHALRPLDEAAKYHRAMADGATFEATLTLNFAGPLPGPNPTPFEQAMEKAGDTLGIEAHFGDKPGEGG